MPDTPVQSAAIQRNVSLQTMNTLRLPVTAAYYLKADNQAAIEQGLQFADAENLPVFILGGGSNTVFSPVFPGLVIHVALRGIEILSEDENTVVIKVAAGEVWDDFLRYCLDNACYGLENLAIIPGTVGAAPIQNIGAYGKEVAHYIEHVHVLDRRASKESGRHTVLLREQCRFAYRDSIFKQQPGRYLVTAVVFRLHKRFTADLSYQALAAVLAGRDISAAVVREAVIQLRNSRLPDPAVLPNAGSFFKNPVVSAEQFAQLQQQYPQIPGFTQHNTVKIPAAWLIEQSGWRGRSLGAAGMYEKQALVLVNHGGAGFADVRQLAQQVAADVWQQFAVALEPEPVFIAP